MATASKPSPLAALTAAAAALPGYAGAAEPELGYRFSYYVEDDLSAADALSPRGSERYEIQTHQLSSQSPLNDEWQLDSDVMIETLSGASPWFVVPNADNDPVQVMSGATIQEERYALYGKAWRDRQQGERLGVAAGVSKEDDYDAVSAGVEKQWDVDQNHSTLSLGGGVSFDRIRPTDGGSERFPDRVTSEPKRTATIYGGVSEILGPRTVLNLSLSYALDTGYLSDPYKLVQVDGRTRNDARPDSRSQYALGLRLRYAVPAWASRLRMDLRHFRDDWGIVSDTVELGTLSRVAEVWRVGATLRWYQQSRADFYAAFFPEERVDGFYSSDYRLSPYGAVSGRLHLDYLGRHWQMGVGVERYDSDARYALRSVPVANPGLVDFTILTLALSYRY
ncbi:MAG: DUF3570 domain-containing protein [Oceanococcaceae bacterium]